TSALRLVIDPSAADSFLQNVFGTDPQTVEAAGALVWSSKTGLHFDGQAGLRRTIPVDAALGPVRISQLVVDVAATDGQVATRFGASGRVALGPVTASIENVGLEVALASVQAPTRGVLGDLDVDFGFKPPTGIGLGIDATLVSGGGFLSFDPDAGRY